MAPSVARLVPATPKRKKGGPYVPYIDTRRFAHEDHHGRAYDDLTHTGNESADDASIATVRALKIDGGCVLKKKAGIAEASDPSKRRYMSGNCRSCLSMRDDHLLYSILAEWYSNCSGPKMISSPVLPPNAWDNVAAILFFEEIGDGLGFNHKPLGRLRMLRAPMDFAMGGSTPAIYGTVDPALAITRYTEWRPDKMFDYHPCAKLRFSWTTSESQATDGGWNRMVLSAIPHDQLFKELCVHTFDRALRGSIRESIFPSPRFCDRHAGDHRSTPLGAEELDGCDDPSLHLVLLPRFFPIPKRGDIPAEWTMTVEDESVTANIDRWTQDQSAQSASHSISKILGSPMFMMWLTGVISNQSFFAARVTEFNPGEDRVYQDDYASLLVGRNIGLDTCVACHSSSLVTIRNAANGIGTNFVTNRDISCFAGAASNYYPRGWMRYLQVPPMRSAFPSTPAPPLTIPTSAVVDLSIARAETRPARASGRTAYDASTDECFSDSDESPPIREGRDPPRRKAGGPLRPSIMSKRSRRGEQAVSFETDDRKPASRPPE